MERSVKVRDLQIGTGVPKICVPITGRTRPEILEQAEAAGAAGADLIEWRADYYEDVEKPVKLAQTAGELRHIVRNMPILFTYRTEDKKVKADREKYVRLKKRACEMAEIDLIDVELFMGERTCKELCEYAADHETRVIISNHDFVRTPSVEMLKERLKIMHELGADIAKIAVMPHESADVLTLLQATDEYVKKDGRGPVITMSMKTLGRISRFSGEVFGSAVTFGTVGKASAPGQIALEDLKRILSLLHED